MEERSDPAGLSSRELTSTCPRSQSTIFLFGGVQGRTHWELGFPVGWEWVVLSGLGAPRVAEQAERRVWVLVRWSSGVLGAGAGSQLPGPTLPCSPCRKLELRAEPGPKPAHSDMQCCNEPPVVFTAMTYTHRC